MESRRLTDSRLVQRLQLARNKARKLFLEPLEDRRLMTVDAADDWLSGAINNSLYGNVLSNDSESGSNSLTASLLSGPSSGYVSLNADGSFSYTPYYGFYGTDSFTYQAEFESESDSAVVTLSINGAPVAYDDSISLDEDASLWVGVGGLTGNDYDPEADALTVNLSSWPASGLPIRRLPVFGASISSPTR